LLSHAFWISPEGETFEIEFSHIATILKYPSKFGYSREKLEQVFQKHGERLGQEASAREEIIKELVTKGWIRVRLYDNYWSVNVADMTDTTKHFLRYWACKVIDGEFGEVDRYAPIRISGLHREWTFSDLEEVGRMEMGKSSEIA
jgi:hypothetical protein